MKRHKTTNPPNRTLKLLITVILSIGTLATFAQSPTASFVFDINAACIPLTVQLTNTSANATSYYWDFGNGNTSTLESPSNVYLNAGVYNIQLIATNAGGVSDTLILVDAVSAIDPPVAGYYAQSTSSCLAGNAIVFNNTTQQSVYWLWDFGDGNTSTSEHPVHSYSNSGIYSVTLIAGNSDSCESLIIRSAYITIFSEWEAEVNVDDTNVCDVSHNFQFSSPTPNITSYLWDFGDGSTSASPSPSHLYTSPGTYTVTLSTINNNGCEDLTIMNDYIFIDAGNSGVIMANSTSGCKPLRCAAARCPPAGTPSSADRDRSAASGLLRGSSGSRCPSCLRRCASSQKSRRQSTVPAIRPSDRKSEKPSRRACPTSPYLSTSPRRRGRRLSIPRPA